MVVFELLLMSGMYKDKRLNGLILAGSVVFGSAFSGRFVSKRLSTIVSSCGPFRTTPGRSSCVRRPRCGNNRIKELCQRIIAGQRAEIQQMRRIVMDNQRE
jgi:hypothetical protein